MVIAASRTVRGELRRSGMRPQLRTASSQSTSAANRGQFSLEAMRVVDIAIGQLGVVHPAHSSQGRVLTVRIAICRHHGAAAHRQRGHTPDDGGLRAALHRREQPAEFAQQAVSAVAQSLPTLRVPALSSTTAPVLAAASSGAALFTRMPLFAATPVETLMSVGVARSSAQKAGHEEHRELELQQLSSSSQCTMASPCACAALGVTWPPTTRQSQKSDTAMRRRCTRARRRAPQRRPCAAPGRRLRGGGRLDVADDLRESAVPLPTRSPRTRKPCRWRACCRR